MDELIKQSPANIDEKIIKEIFDKNDGNIMNSLMELWEIKDENEKEQTKEQNEWDEIRDTCDIFDGEMNNMMAKLRTNVI